MDLSVFLNFIFFLCTASGQSFTSKVCREIIRIIEKELLLFLD